MCRRRSYHGVVSLSLVLKTKKMERLYQYIGDKCLRSHRMATHTIYILYILYYIYIIYIYPKTKKVIHEVHTYCCKFLVVSEDNTRRLPEALRKTALCK